MYRKYWKYAIAIGKLRLFFIQAFVYKWRRSGEVRNHEQSMEIQKFIINYHISRSK